MFSRLSWAVLTGTDLIQASITALYSGLAFWILLQYCLRTWPEGHENVAYEQRNFEWWIVDQVVRHIRGRAIVLLDSGRFGLCSNAVQVDDEVVLSDCLKDSLLLRRRHRRPEEAAGRHVGNQQAQDPHIGETEAGYNAPPTHWFVGHLFIDGLGFGVNLDEVWVRTISRKPNQVIIMG
ncbi:uncharacterized protein B0I36DRAFT_322058 [Microdochium trichocladiopsis]|uniref:Uncharacterized protein n=1 Tax=Microdochium trichocladiopsis TaxID=1682393 RepID=A0A9P8Y5I7_9PEZI|nr:uncharacterized protein B0I36DRAFT_322058 [Microdochium trichocladiopsis]KAH7030565.1 hypothetical protein B0I36DRAFT_322058 [Microdochium trichocladiopsis]